MPWSPTAFELGSQNLFWVVCLRTHIKKYMYIYIYTYIHIYIYVYRYIYMFISFATLADFYMILGYMSYSTDVDFPCLGTLPGPKLGLCPKSLD